MAIYVQVTSTPENSGHMLTDSKVKKAHKIHLLFRDCVPQNTMNTVKTLF